MHVRDDASRRLSDRLLGYLLASFGEPMDPHWGARPAPELEAELAGALTPDGIGAEAALRLFDEVLLPACRPMDSPLNLAYVPTAPSDAAKLFDMVVTSSAIFAGTWESGAGAIAAENQALSWLGSLAGYPASAGGCFVSGGSSANLSALVAARHRARTGRPGAAPPRWSFAATSQVHSSVRAAARVMDVDVVTVEADAQGRMTGRALAAALADDSDGLFAVVATLGTTNVGAVDDFAGIADVCERLGVWLHIDAAYGGAVLCAPSTEELRVGFARSDSFGVDPHKWLFAPYDCAALLYRDPGIASKAHAQHGEYLDNLDRGEWNPADFAYHLSRRARGLPLWFSLATYGTDAYTAAVEETLSTARAFADELRDRDRFTLLLEPSLSVVVFEVNGWTPDDYRHWTVSRAREGIALIVPTTWSGRTCYRVCLVNPRTTASALSDLLDDMEAFA
jgi:glutamate/tyrosine decarboxylase-like PLP-dependent enzyme